MTTGGPESFGALAGLKVIDLTQMLAGPFATMLLADHGALVIKIEPPEGEMTRSVGPYRAGDETRALGAFFQSVNRNKRSVCLDLKSEAGRVAFKSLVGGEIEPEPPSCLETMRATLLAAQSLCTGQTVVLDEP